MKIINKSRAKEVARIKRTLAKRRKDRARHRKNQRQYVFGQHWRLTRGAWELVK